MKYWYRKTLKHYLMLLPFFLFFAVFFLYPIVEGLNISFYKWDSVNPAVFVGIQNYVNLLKSRDFVISFTNILKYVSITVPVGISVAFGLALFVNNLKGPLANFFRSVYFIPTMMPLFLAASVWRWMYAPEVGIINTAMQALGMQSINWLKNPDVMIFSLIIVDVWRSAGWNMVILLAGLKNIPQDYYDAARVDGANSWQELIYVTIPQLEPVLFFVIAQGFIFALQVFDAPWLLTLSTTQGYGGRLKALLFPVMDMFGRAFGVYKFGEASAYGFLLTILIMIITAILFAVRRKE
ncbi:MAG: sugar ABC transporter permease [Anaerolineaceae bacterium]|nr:sugar ABC transporter permease [Anaerolineaceae bacterium]